MFIVMAEVPFRKMGAAASLGDKPRAAPDRPITAAALPAAIKSERREVIDVVVESSAFIGRLDNIGFIAQSRLVGCRDTLGA